MKTNSTHPADGAGEPMPDDARQRLGLSMPEPPAVRRCRRCGGQLAEWFAGPICGMCDSDGQQGYGLGRYMGD